MRWLYFLALALLAGGLGFRLLVLRGPLRPETERRFYLVLAVGRSERSRSGSSPSCFAPRTRCSFRSGGSCTAT